MLGIKQRRYGSVTDICLDQLVPSNHFYRQLETKLDLSFVRDFVGQCYLPGGRPSLDPVVFFKLQLVMFFEGIRSERQLLRVVADRLSLRWYLGYDLGEALPDHSTLTKIRERYGLEVFRKFFEAIVKRCQEAGLVWGHDLYFDGTQVLANAALASAQPRFAFEAHLARLFDSPAPDSAEATPAETELSSTPPPTPGVFSLTSTDPETLPPTSVTAHPISTVGSEETKPVLPLTLPVQLDEAQGQTLEEESQARHNWLEQAGKQNRQAHSGRYRRMADFTVSKTDQDASLMHLKAGGVHFGYQTHYGADGGKARIILSVLVTPGEVMENQPMLDMLWQLRFRYKLRPCQVTGDTTYGTVEIIKALEEANIRAYMPLPDFDNRTPFFGKGQFRYDQEQDCYICPQGQPLIRRSVAYNEQVIKYRAEAQTCEGCALKAKCTESTNGREINRHFDEAYVEKIRSYHSTAAYRKAIRKRQVWVEPLFGEAKQWHGMRRFRLRGLIKVNGEALIGDS